MTETLAFKYDFQDEKAVKEYETGKNHERKTNADSLMKNILGSNLIKILVANRTITEPPYNRERPPRTFRNNIF